MRKRFARQVPKKTKPEAGSKTTLRCQINGLRFSASGDGDHVISELKKFLGAIVNFESERQ